MMVHQTLAAAVMLLLLLNLAQGFPREGVPDGNFLPNEIAPLPSLGRERRGLVEDDNGLWPLAVVDYRYGDDLVDKAAIGASIKEFEDNTCLKFNNVTPSYQGPHIIFRNDNSTCFSFVGRQSNSTLGQDLLLASRCTANAMRLLHMLGHAVGMDHVHTRPDRDDYVRILVDNVPSDEFAKNFEKINSRTFDVPYDFTSALHLFSYSYSTTGNTTIRSLDPFNQGLMLVPKTGLTFMDKLLINRGYQCIARWLVQCNITVERCENNGYTGEDCACVCPPGTSGSTCATITASPTEYLRQTMLPLNANVTAEGNLTSPGYPTPCSQGTVFTKVIQAPSGQRVKLTFTAFNMAPRCDGVCCNEGVEIQVAPSAAPNATDSGNWYCGDEITAGEVIRSVGREMVVFYYLKPNPSNTNTGFSATIEFEADP